MVLKNSSLSFAILLLFFSCKNKGFHAQLINEPVPIENNTDRPWIEGWLWVDENRTELESNQIKIPFIYSKAPDSLRLDETPILVMSGGPGNSSLNMANGMVYAPWGKSHHIIVLEQRGTIYTEPSLVCPAIDSLRIQGMIKGLYGASIDGLNRQALNLCYNQFKKQNIDLNGYNTLETVEDIEALRKALHLDQLILYGMSYSCNLMKAYARTYPDKVKALVLDSPLPHTVNYEEDGFQNIDTTFQQVINHYTGSNTLFEDWKNYILSIQDSVFKISIDSLTYSYTKNELIDIPLSNMSAHNSLPNVVTSIENIINGNHEDVANIISSYLGRSSQALGMRFSLWVAEEIPEERQEVIANNERKYSWLKGYAINNVTSNTAKDWPVHAIYEQRKWPTQQYNGPVFILSGQFDPWTPVTYGIIMKNSLPNAKHKIYPEKTHLPGFTAEGKKDVVAFLNAISN